MDDYTAAVIAGDPPAIQLYDQAVQTANSQRPLLVADKKSIPQTIAKFLINDLFALIRDDQEERRAREGDDPSKETYPELIFKYPV